MDNIVTEDFLDGMRKDKTRAVLLEMQNNGKTLVQALKKVGVTKDEWQNWKERGFVDSIMQQMKPAMAQLAYMELLPGMKARLELLANMAIGIAPGDIKLSAKDILAAQKEINAILPIASLGDTGRTNDLDFLKEFKPTVVNISNTATHIYNGAGNSHKMGAMDSVLDTYEVVEVESY